MRLKTCTKCGKTLPLDKFYKLKSSKDGLRSWCKECSKAANKTYYTSHREDILAYQKDYAANNPVKVSDYQKEYYATNKRSILDYNKGYREQKRQLVDSLKTDCVKCGETRKYIIDFHHKNPSEKSFEISDIFKRSENEVRDEIKKCVCLCRNCHGEFHHLYGIKPKLPLEALEEYLSD